MPMYRRLLNLAAAIILLTAAAGAGTVVCAEVVRNGSFDAGLESWMLAGEFGDWNPLVFEEGNTAVDLHPPQYSFTGPILAQSLNVTGVAGVECTVSLKLKNQWSPDGNAVGIYLAYVDSSHVLHKVKVLNPSNNSIPWDWTTVNSTYTFPSDARKLVGIALVKEDYGSFLADDISLLVPGSVVGDIPVVTGVTPSSGPYGTVVTIEGNRFGANTPPVGMVLLDGKADGITIQTWSDTQITARTDEPAEGGSVMVVADFVMGGGYASYTVTSPYFRAKIAAPSKKVVRGQTADYVIAVDFANDFATEGGISFSVPDAPAGTVTFGPTPLMGPGGSLMSVNTSGLAAGVYNWNLRCHEAGSVDRTVPFTLEVVTVTDLSFNLLNESWQLVPVDSLQYTAQSVKEVTMTGIDSNGDELAWELPIVLTSGNPAILEVYPEQWSGDVVAAVDSGTTTLTATCPDGYSESIPVSISIPQTPRITSIAATPSIVTNKGDQTITFTAIGSDPLCQVNFSNISLENWESNWYDSARQYVATATVAEGIEPGTRKYRFGATICSPSPAYRMIPITVVNDPSRGTINGAIYPLTSDHHHEASGILEFYDTNGNLVDEVGVWSMDGKFSLCYIEPGTYKLRFMPYSYTSSPQWWCNTDSFEAAAAIEVTPGGVVEGIYFFPGQAPPPEPTTVVSTSPADGEQNVPVETLVTATFSNTVMSWSVDTSTFVLTDGAGQGVDGTVTCDNSLTAVFTPSAPLADGETYTATITSGVMDVYGNYLAEDYSWSFTTAGATYYQISELADLPDGTRVLLSGKVAYLTDMYFAYVEEPNRVSGIRIEGNVTSLLPNTRASISGVMWTTSGGERCVFASSATSGEEDTVRPLGAGITAVKSAMMSGLYVRTWGKVMSVLSDRAFVLSDGSDEGVIVYSGSDHGLSEGQHCAVSGAAGYDNGRVIYAVSIDTPDQSGTPN